MECVGGFPCEECAKEQFPGTLRTCGHPTGARAEFHQGYQSTMARKIRKREAAETATIVLAVLASGAVFTWLGPVLKPFLVAIFLFYAAESGAKMLARLGLRLTTAYACFFSLAVIMTILLGQLIYRESALFLSKWPKYEARLEAVLDRVKLPEMFFQPGESPRTNSASPGQLDELPHAPADSSKPSGVPSLLSNTVRVATKAVLDYVFRHSLDVAELLTLVLVYSIFLLIGSRKMPSKIMRAFPGEDGQRILMIEQGINASMEKFMTVKTVVGLGMAASAAVIMLVFGLDHWLLWSFVLFVSNYVTYIGSMAACVPPCIIACLGLGSPLAAAGFIVLLVFNRLLWIDFVEIRMAGKELSLDPVLMFLWLAYWGWAWGVLGLILAYPMLAAVKIVLLHIQGCEAWATLLSDD